MQKKILLASWLSIFTINVALAATPATPATPATTVSTTTAPTAPNDSILEKKLHEMHEADKNPLSIAFYRPTYVLPFYYTASPYNAIYRGNTPNGQSIMHTELKAQLSLTVPVVDHFLNDKTSLNIAYTQLNYWQVYASSQYFRETNYEPEIFISSHLHRSWLVSAGLDHQSNGRGGPLERSWNRAMLASLVSGENWLMGVKVWDLIFKSQSSALHNPDIAHYLGYDAVLFSYKYHDWVASAQIQNLESGFARGSTILTLSYPISKHFLLYTQYFTGYGQSMIEYNHKTQSVGIGIALNDWI